MCVCWGVGVEWYGGWFVDKDKWEDLKKGYLDNVRLIYERINKHYDEKRAVQQDNIEKKEILLTKIKSLNEQLENIKTARDWEEMFVLFCSRKDVFLGRVLFSQQKEYSLDQKINNWDCWFKAKNKRYEVPIDLNDIRDKNTFSFIFS